jgi:protocatechuate 3,4-dioxygenase alpha subunit
MTMTDKTTGRTPSQTVGPYLHIGLVPGRFGVREIFSPVVADAGLPGTHIRIEGRVLDGAGAIMPDAMLEIWQADAEGRYAHPADGRPPASNSFRGFGRAATDENGGFFFITVKPGTVAGPGGKPQAPHINVGVFARGMLKRLFTRLYFAGEPANAADPILALVPPSGAPPCWPNPTRPRPASGASTSICRAPTRRCSSTRDGPGPPGSDMLRDRKVCYLREVKPSQEDSRCALPSGSS